LPSSGKKSIGYRLVMDSDVPAPDAQSTITMPYDSNDPFQTALVRVHHCPNTTTWVSPTAWCAIGHKESWWVYPDPQSAGAGTGTTTFLTPLVAAANAHQVASVIPDPGSSAPELGQYSVPFLFRIEGQ
jgi:hypothetical protein